MARQLLETAAVIGRSFGLDTVRAASGRSDEEAADGLDELVGRRAWCASCRRAGARLRLHARQAARARLRADRAGAPAAAAPARGRGAPADRARAGGGGARWRSTCAWRATTRARPSSTARPPSTPRRCSRTRDALEHLDAALALGYPDPPRCTSGSATCARSSATTPGALASYETAAAHARAPRRGADRAQARRRAPAARRVGAGGGALRGRSRGGRPPATQGLRARILADLALTLHQSGRTSGRRELAEEARALAEAAADRRAQAQAHNMLGMLARAAGQARRGAARARAQPRARRASWTTPRRVRPRSTTSRWWRARRASPSARSS